jgi:lipoate-protein ligase A
MKYLKLSFADPASMLACDEALLDFCEAKDPGEILRLWEPAERFVVLGYSNKIATEVKVSACASSGVAVLRRFSGGGAVLQGPGCLNYTLVLRNKKVGYLGDIRASYERVLGRHKQLVEELTGERVEIEGISDLAIGGQKFSGNSQHRKQRYSLFHGTLLLNFDFSLMEACLYMPSRQPSYRQRRSHESFLKNLEIDPARIIEGLTEAWGTDGEFTEVPYQRIEELVKNRYSRREWNFKF